MPTTAGRPNHPASAMEPHAQQFPKGGNRTGERAPWLGGAVPGATADDGPAHPRREQVMDGPTDKGAGLWEAGETGPRSPEEN